MDAISIEDENKTGKKILETFKHSLILSKQNIFMLDKILIMGKNYYSLLMTEVLGKNQVNYKEVNPEVAAKIRDFKNQQFASQLKVEELNNVFSDGEVEIDDDRSYD